MGAGGPSKHFYKLKIPNVLVYDLNISVRDYKHKRIVRMRKGHNQRFIIGDLMDTPFNSNTFDVCFSSNVFEHIEEPWRAAEECVRVTKRKGTILVFAPFGWRHHDQPDYYRYSSEGLRYLFERTGKVKTVDCQMMRIPKKKDTRWLEYWRTVYHGVKK